MTSSPIALVVEPRLSEAAFLTNTLSAAGFRVRAAPFVEAKTLLGLDPPDLLVAEVCQGEFNGLHLLIRGRAKHPQLAALVTCPYEDPVLRHDAETFGAVFVVKPITPRDLVAAAARALHRSASDREPIRPPFERRHKQRRLAGAAFLGMERRHGDRRREAIAPL